MLILSNSLLYKSLWAKPIVVELSLEITEGGQGTHEDSTGTYAS